LAGNILSAQGEVILLPEAQHVRRAWTSDIERVAVGSADLLTAEPTGSRELLLLGKGRGRTSLIVWTRDGQVQNYSVLVQRDIRLLQATLKRLHPRIEVEIAPDRDVVVLTGVVPNLSMSRAAEELAQLYLDAGERRAESKQGEVLIKAQSPQEVGAKESAPESRRQPDKERERVGTVLNLLELQELPPLLEEKLTKALEAAGGNDIRIRRMVKGPVADDEKDVFVLEGTVASQVVLVRVLLTAAQVLTQRRVSEDEVRVIADESGALMSNRQQQLQGQQGQQGAQGQMDLGGANSRIFGNGNRGGGTMLSNQIHRNLGRAKAIEAAEGRLLSFLRVTDLPQVRVNIRLYEVNRNRLRAYAPRFGVLGSSITQGSLNPPLASSELQGSSAQRTGGAGTTALQSVLSFLGGTITSQTQLSTAHFAIDAALSNLEREGIARSLSAPSLTVLSGEQAMFQVGGQIPIPQSFASAFGQNAASAPGVFNSIVFEEFGIQLGVRPLVGESGDVTLDVQPQIVTPNAELTASIRDSTGTNQLTTAFLSRGLRTSARLQDGQALLIGGLLSREGNETRNSTPGVRDVPGLGWLFKDFNRSDDGRELIIMVNPVVIRDPAPGVGLWAYPETSELLPRQIAP
jgi:Flp pilus assembly secretin CpaC